MKYVQQVEALLTTAGPQPLRAIADYLITQSPEVMEWNAVPITREVVGLLVKNGFVLELAMTTGDVYQWAPPAAPAGSGQQQADDSDIKPCPCCGGPAEMDAAQPYRPIAEGKPLGEAVAIYCTRCNASVSRCAEDTPEQSREDIIFDVKEQWNKRPASIAPPPAPSDICDCDEPAKADGYKFCRGCGKAIVPPAPAVQSSGITGDVPAPAVQGGDLPPELAQAAHLADHPDNAVYHSFCDDTRGTVYAFAAKVNALAADCARLSAACRAAAQAIRWSNPMSGAYVSREQLLDEAFEEIAAALAASNAPKSPV